MSDQLVEYEPGAGDPGTFVTTTSDLSGDAVHDAEADTRHGLSRQ